MCKHQQRFGLDVHCSALVHNFNYIFFKWAFVPGWTINEFPAFANTRTLYAMLTEISTYTNLEKWLSDNYNFEDGHVLAIKEKPLEILIGYTIIGNYKANTERQIKQFKLIPENIIEWTLDKQTILVGDDNYIEGIYAINVESGIGLEFFTPASFKLITDKLFIEEQPIIKTTFQPWISDKEIYVTADLNEIPKPEYWKNKLKKYGHEIVFRYFGSEEVNVNNVPYPDYQGYFIQLPERLKETNNGIFLKHLKFENDKCTLSFENQDRNIISIWNDLTKIIADLPNAKINSGNCEFTGEEWKNYVTENF